MTFKKYLLFLVIAALAVVMVACGSGSKDGEGSEATDENTTSENEDATDLEGVL